MPPFLQLPHQFERREIESIVVGGQFGGKDQGCPRLVDEDRIRLVDHREEQAAHDQRFARTAPEQLAHQPPRSEEHTSELQSLMRISYAVFCLNKTINSEHHTKTNQSN